MNAMMMMNPMNQMIPIGFRFNPSDEEVIVGYLWARVVGEEVPWNAVAEKQIYGALPPWEVFNDGGDFFNSKIEGGATKKSTYVFTTLTRASKQKIARRAGSGTWKAQGASTKISSSGTGEIIGYMRSLSFVPDAKATPPLDSGHWTMHEYSLSEDMARKSANLNAADLVICKITKIIKINDNNNNNTLPLPMPPLPEEEKSSPSESAPPSKKQKMTLICGEGSAIIADESLPNWDFIDVDEFLMQGFPDGAAVAMEGSINNNNMLPPLLLPPPPPLPEQSSSSESAPPPKKQKTTLMCDDEPLPGCYLDDNIDIDELWLQCFPATEGSIIPVEDSAAMPDWDPDVIDIDNIFGSDYQLPIDYY